MKKLLSFIILFAVVLGWNAHDASAKSMFQNSRRTKYHSKKTVKKQVKKSEFSALVYEPVWFSSLTERQQLHYLDTIEKLVMKLNRSRIANLDSSFMKFFFPHLDARNRINNGFIFEGTNDGKHFDDFLKSLNILGGPLDPKCEAPEQLCAPYMGMVCSDGQAKLACSNDSTPTCAARGSQECLRSTLSGCGMNDKGEALSSGKSTKPFCKKLDEIYQRGTQNVKAHCEGTHRAAKEWCKAAVASLKGEEVPPSPDEADIPLGKDCEALSRRMAEAKDGSRGHGRNKGDKGSAGSYYWRNMIGLATQACGIPSINTAYNRYGSCSGRDTVNHRSPVTSTKMVDHKKGSKDFKTCFDKKKKEIEDAAVKSIAGLKAKRLPNREYTQEVNKVYDRKSRALKLLNDRSVCSESVTAPVEDKNGNVVTSEYDLDKVMSLASKVFKHEDLSDDEENKWRAATGMKSSTFRKVFCGPKDYDKFKQVLAGNYNFPVDVIGSGSVEDTLRDHLKVARIKLANCSSALKSNSDENGDGCRMYTHDDDRHDALRDGNILRCASESNPILAYNIKDKTCSMIVGNSSEATEYGDSGNVMERKHSLWVKFANGRKRRVPIKNMLNFAQSHDLRVYRCNGDRAPSRNCVYNKSGEKNEGQRPAANP